MHILNKQKEQHLQSLTEIFLEKNAHINLSALRTFDACWNGNVLDSLPFLTLIEQGIIGTPASIIDVGTGGGFPLLPLAIMLPDTTCIGLDSTGKKLKAIEQIAVEAEISNVSTVTGRAEEIGHDPLHREKYDVATARAVAKIPELLEYCSPLVQKGGHIVLWKSLHGTELEESAHAQKELGCVLIHSLEYDLSDDWGKRRLLVFEKRVHTPKKYPRAIGVPKRESL